MKAIAVGAFVCLLSWSAQAQQANCINQYADAPGMTPAKLIATGHDIKAGWAGGLWLQKGNDVYFCNSGIAREDAAICWKLREPLKGQPCQ